MSYSDELFQRQLWWAAATIAKAQAAEAKAQAAEAKRDA